MSAGANNSTNKGYASEFYVAAAAFLLSLVIALISIISTIRGATISALPPDRILVYRNGQRPDSLLAIAVRIPLINTSSSYNDMLTGASIRLGSFGHRFEKTGTVAPILLDEDAGRFCRLRDLSCVHLGRMAIPDLPDEAIIVPAGGAHARYYSFEILCPVTGPECSPYRSFSNTLGALGDRPFEIIVELNFYADGRRVIRCRIGPLNQQWVRREGWQTLVCNEPAEILGNPSF